MVATNISGISFSILHHLTKTYIMKKSQISLQQSKDIHNSNAHTQGIGLVYIPSIYSNQYINNVS